jgi:hypothetical protein
MQKLRMFSIPVSSSKCFKPQKYELLSENRLVELHIIKNIAGRSLTIFNFQIPTGNSFLSHSMKRLLIVFGFLAITSAASGQNELSGHVLDSVTQEPIPFANVFFANSTLGTATNEAGEFTLKNFASGKYDVVISFVGYKTIQVPMSFSNNQQRVKVLLSQEIVQLNEVVISPDTSHRASNLNQFIKSFIGETQNAPECRILNSKNIDLFYEGHDRVLMAFAKKPIEIENKALGYKIIYQLHSFERDYINQTQTFFGIPRFELLTPKNESQLKRWEKERKRAYEGSFSHLIRLMRQGILDGPFIIQELYKVPNRKRPSERFLQGKIKYWRNKLFEETGKPFIITQSNGKVDSLSYYMRLQREPVLSDSVGKTFTKTDELLDASRTTLLYKGILRVIYKNEREEAVYARAMGRGPMKVQLTDIHLQGEKLTLYDNGYYEDVQEVFFEGYMGWSEKISDLLPLEYKPEG